MFNLVEIAFTNRERQSNDVDLTSSFTSQASSNINCRIKAWLGAKMKKAYKKIRALVYFSGPEIYFTKFW